MTIQEVEARTGLPRATVRYYEREGLLSPQRLENGYRDYSEDNITTLLRIKLLRELGIALEDLGEGMDFKTYKEDQYRLLAEGLRASLDMEAVYRIIGERL